MALTLTSYGYAHTASFASLQTSLTPTIQSIARSIIELHKNLISRDSLALLALSAIPYTFCYRCDKNIHAYFYCPTHHKNLHQMPEWCNSFARYGLAIPILGLGSLAFFSSDYELQRTSQIFLIGLPFLVFGNKITKKIRFEACYRPWNEHFSSEKRSPGGFPSGHAAYLSYMTVLYGLRYGPTVAVPLALYGVFVSINFCMSNRHYLSQIVAGIGLGAAYALAAHKVINLALSEHISCALTQDFRGNPALCLHYSF